MKSRRTIGICVGTIVLGAAALMMISSSPAETPVSKPEASNPAAANPAADRARREVHLLDDIYKSAIVLITEHYVDGTQDMPAGIAFKALFKSMKDKGWHEVRLLDALGEPLNAEDAPRDDFERKAIKEMLAGKPYYEEIETKDGKQYLHAATPVPMVMDKCIMCHENFKGKKVIGALGYLLPLDVTPVQTR